MLVPIKKTISDFDFSSITEIRKGELHVLVDYLSHKLKIDSQINLVFVCTHNSRRSQFAQVWAEVAAKNYNLPIRSFSAGTEVTEANERTISSLQRTGFIVTKKGEKNPLYEIHYGDLEQKIWLFSKEITHDSLPNQNFAAIMTCSHAEENCPFIPNCDSRIPLRYSDPKINDGTELEKVKYDEKSLEIGTELFYIFSQIASN